MRSRLALCVAALLPLAAHAQGGPPMLTDDPGTPGDRHLETNLAIALDAAGHERLWSLPIVDLNYGVGDRIQLNFETTLALSTGNGPRWGGGPASIAVKWRFVDDDRHGIFVSTYPRVEWSTFGSSPRRRLAERGTRVFLPIEFARQLGRLGLDAEIGSLLSDVDRSRWVYGLVTGFQPRDETEIMAELHGETLTTFGESVLTANAGIRQRLVKPVTLIASFGRDLRAPAVRAWIGYFGIQWLL